MVQTSEFIKLENKVKKLEDTLQLLIDEANDTTKAFRIIVERLKALENKKCNCKKK